MWAPLREVVNFALLMGALFLAVLVLEVFSWLVEETRMYFKNKKEKRKKENA